MTKKRSQRKKASSNASKKCPQSNKDSKPETHAQSEDDSGARNPEETLQNEPQAASSGSLDQDPEREVAETIMKQLLEDKRERIKMQVELAKRRREAVMEIWSLMDSTRRSRVLDVARLDWIEDAFRITKFMDILQMAKSRFRVFIVEEGSDADRRLFHSSCCDQSEQKLYYEVKVGVPQLHTNQLPGLSVRSPATSTSVEPGNRSITSIMIGKVGNNDNTAREVVLMLARMSSLLKLAMSTMQQALPDQNKLEEVSICMPTSLDVPTGRKLVECVWKDVGIRVNYCVLAKGTRDSAPRSRLGAMVIRAGVTNPLMFNAVYQDLETKIKPSHHGVEVDKVALRKDGNISLRIVETKLGGKMSFARAIANTLGYTVAL